MMAIMKKNSGWVPISVLLAFPRMKKMKASLENIRQAAESSDTLKLNAEREALWTSEEFPLLGMPKSFQDELYELRQRLERVQERHAIDKLGLGRPDWKRKYYKENFKTTKENFKDIKTNACIEFFR